MGPGEYGRRRPKVKVVGWAMSDNYKTPLIHAAVEMAVRNHDIADEPYRPGLLTLQG